MDISVDIETYEKNEEGKLVPVLDATKFYLGVIYFNDRKPQVFDNKNDMWNKILELGLAEAKRGKVLNIYGHNHQYDFLGYAPQDDKKIVRFCETPFIYAYRDALEIKGEVKRKEYIKFLDTWAIFKMSLKVMGDLIGIPKMEMPEDEEATFDNIAKYCINDCKVTLEAINFMKKKLKEQEIGIKRIYTINQIAGNNLLREFSKTECWHIFKDKRKYEAYPTYRKEEIHSAYRGGRCEAFQVGEFDDVNYIDFNSLYPYSATKIKFVDLKSERKILKPLTIVSQKELLEKEGVSKCIIYNKNNKYGLLPIRTPVGNYFPKENKIIIGTWTHIELRKAIQEGYEILDIEWSVIYTSIGKNPFKEIMPRYYKLRKESDNEFDNYFYKMMMNAGIGKLAQHRNGQEIVVDDIEKLEEYIQDGYEALEGISGTMNYKYIKTHNNTYKKFYMPIIPTFINAYARVMMYEFYKNIPLKDLIYTDTDSIIFTGNHLEKFSIEDNAWGKFKIEHISEKCLVYGKKTYAIGDEMKLAGFRKKGISMEEFKTGEVESKKMVTFNTQSDVLKAGSFISEKRNLHTQLENYELAKEKLDNENVLIDNDITDIQYFMNTLKKTIKKYFSV